MRVNLRRYYDKWFIPVLILLFLLLCFIMKLRKMNDIPKTINPFKASDEEVVIPVLVMTCDEQILKRSINSLRLLRPNRETFPIIVAQFCSGSTAYVLNLMRWDFSITHLKVPVSALGRHYKFALNYVFRTLKYKAVIVLEDDLRISPDFFEYFLGTYQLLKRDASVWCVSAWNDNCKKGLVEETKISLLHKTDYFPKNGWMISSETWDKIESRVGDLYNTRISNIVNGRVCIRPEISRTYKLGSGEPFLDDDQRLLNTQFVQFTKEDFTYLSKNYDRFFINHVYSCPETTAYDLKMGNIANSSPCLRITYSDSESFTRAARTLGLVYDMKHGVPRTAFHGIVQCYINERRVYLTSTLIHPVSEVKTSARDSFNIPTVKP